MIFKKHQNEITELISEEVLIGNLDDAIELIGNLYFEGSDKIVIHEKNLTPNFFDLKTKIAGEILQKFSTYRIRLVIVGDFSKFSSTSLQSFILESNKGTQINFVGNISEALKSLQ